MPATFVAKVRIVTAQPAGRSKDGRHVPVDKVPNGPTRIASAAGHVKREADGALFEFQAVQRVKYGQVDMDLMTSPDGEELWVMDRARMTVLRYAWPD